MVDRSLLFARPRISSFWREIMAGSFGSLLGFDKGRGLAVRNEPDLSQYHITPKYGLANKTCMVDDASQVDG